MRHAMHWLYTHMPMHCCAVIAFKWIVCCYDFICVIMIFYLASYDFFYILIVWVAQIAH